MRDKLRTSQHSDFIKYITEDVARLDNGAQLLGLLSKFNFAVKPISESPLMTLCSSTTRAYLHIDNNINTLYLSDNCHADDMVHELSHIQHLFELPQTIVSPPDLKHRYITKAIREADAYARQAEALIVGLKRPEILQRVTEIYAQTQLSLNDPDKYSEVYESPCRIFLYNAANLSPAALLNRLENDETSINDIMLDVFCGILHDFVTVDYEEFHLDQLNDEINCRTEQADPFEYRVAPCAFHTKADALFFADCLRQYGSWLWSRSICISRRSIQ